MAVTVGVVVVLIVTAVILELWWLDSFAYGVVLVSIRGCLWGDGGRGDGTVELNPGPLSPEGKSSLWML